MPGAGLHRALQRADIVHRQMDLAPLAAFPARIGQPMGGEQVGRLVAAERHEAVIVEVRDGLGLAKALDVILARKGVVVNREQAPLDQVRLRGPAHADRHVGLAHGEVEFFVGEDQLDPDIRVEVEKLTHALRQPRGAESDRGGDLQIAGRPLGGLDQPGAGVVQAQLHVARRAEQQVALLGEQQAPRMAVEQRRLELALEGADLAAHGRLAETDVVAGLGEAARLRDVQEDPDLIPIQGQNLYQRRPSTRVPGTRRLERITGRTARRRRRVAAPDTARVCKSCIPA